MRLHLERFGIVAATGFTLIIMLATWEHHSWNTKRIAQAYRQDDERSLLDRLYPDVVAQLLNADKAAHNTTSMPLLKMIRNDMLMVPDFLGQEREQRVVDELMRAGSVYPPFAVVTIPGPLPLASQDPAILSLSAFLTKWEGREGEACPHPDTFGAYYNRTYGETLPKEDNIDSFFHNMGNCDMYRDTDDEAVDKVVDDLRTLPIERVAALEGGTQVKLMLQFEGGKLAAFKPLRFDREYEAERNQFYFSEFERHNAEIAAFHLDRLLGIRHAIPTTGRVFNLSSEIQAHADYDLNQTFFVSPAANLCFEGICGHYCDMENAICAEPHMLEGSVQLFLPPRDIGHREKNKSPYRRTYRSDTDGQIADWQIDNSYCDEKVKTKWEWAHGTKLINLVEEHIFDFLTGNQDRHHFEGFDFFERDPYPIFFDNGRAFGRSYMDDLDILLPLTQCCVIRPRLLKRLLGFYTGPESLAQALSASMATEPVAPILAAKHYPALQRRLVHILTTVKKCIDKTGNPDDVIMYEYYNQDLLDLFLDSTEDETEAPLYTAENS